MYEGTDVENFCLMLARMYSKHTHRRSLTHTYAGTKKNSGGDALEDEVRQVVQEAQEKKKLKSLNIVTW